MKETKYQVLSPDGIPIQPMPFRSEAAAKTAFAAWIKKFEAQGYYASAVHGRIPIKDLPNFIRFEKC